MGKLEKLLQKIKNNPKQVRFDELDKILIRSGFEKRQPRGGSSHYYYTKGPLMISVPYRQPYILTTYVVAAIKILERMGEDD
ncbi:MAG TPA: toxin HicA [Desulfotomaculum sp.]|nr:toxin HicA [Desulfotomaculum sp.]